MSLEKRIISMAMIFFMINSQLGLVLASDAIRSSNGQYANDSDQSSGIILQKEPCPQNLKKWVSQDLENIDDLVANANEHQDTACRAKLENLSKESKINHDKQKNTSSGKKNNNNFFDSVNVDYSKSLSLQNKTVITNFDQTLKGCSSLSPEKEQLALTRFYSASKKLTYVNEQLLNEVAFYDSYLPPGSPLGSIECPVFQPSIQKKCDSIRRENEVCKSTQQSRFEKLVARTQANISKISELKKAYKQCYFSKINSPMAKEANGRTLKPGVIDSIEQDCGRINAAITILEAQTPWIKGKKFQDIALSRKANPRVNEDEIYKTDKKILNDAIYEQLNADRQALRDTYDKNLQHIRCLTYNSQDSGQDCDIGEIRRDINAYGDFKPFNYQSKETVSPKSTQFSVEQTDQCLMSYGQKVQDAHDKKMGALKTAGEVSLMAVTFIATDGLAAVAWLSRARKVGQMAEVGGEVVQAGRLGSAMQKSSKIMQATNITEVVQGINTIESMYGLSKIAESCHKDNPYNRSQLTQSNVDSKKLCQDPEHESALNQEQAMDYETDCAVGALLGGLMQMPFMAGAKYMQKLKNMKNMSDDELKALLKRGDRAELEKVLAQNSALTPEQRKDVAQALVKRNLSTTEKDCIMKAHNVGVGKVMKITGTESNTYESGDLFQKKSILSKCGFSSDEVTILMRSGVTGAREELAQLAANTAGKKFGREISQNDGRVLTENTSALLSADVKASAKARENLKAAGYTDAEIDYIANSGGKWDKPFDPRASNTNTAQLAAQRASAERAAAERLAAQKAAEAAAAAEVAKKEAARKASELQASQNPFLQKPNTRLVEKEDLIFRVGQGSAKPSPTDAKMYLNTQGAKYGYRGQEGLFHTVNKITDDTIGAIKNAQSALSSGRITDSRSIAAIKNELEALKVKCRGLASVAAQAGLNGASYQSNLQNRINTNCN